MNNRKIAIYKESGGDWTLEEYWNVRNALGTAETNAEKYDFHPAKKFIFQSKSRPELMHTWWEQWNLDRDTTEIITYENFIEQQQKTNETTKTLYTGKSVNEHGCFVPLNKTYSTEWEAWEHLCEHALIYHGRPELITIKIQ